MWLDEDIEAALEWQAEQDAKCPGCGRPSDESMADEDHAPDYEAVSRRCRACEVRDIAAHDLQAMARENNTELNGFYFGVREVSGNG